MEFRNEILPVGRLSYIGTPLRTNVRASWRRGVEVDLAVQPLDRLHLGLTATVMRARIVDFTDDETGQSYHNVEPLLTPKVITSQHASLDLTRTVSVSLTGRYYGRSQLDNTENSALTLPAYYTADISAEWTLGVHGLSVHVNNATNSRRYASGHVAFGEARYYVLPPLNAFLLARIGM
jgi:iron complex outermembrane receptor protein